MKENFSTIAKYNEDTNKKVASILGKLSNEEREKNRKSFYGSLSALFRHNVGATCFFLSLFKDGAKDNAEALAALESTAKIAPLEGKLTEAQWKKVVSSSKIVDKAFEGV